MALTEDVVHDVAEDECLSSIAESYGHLWKTIWFHSRNTQLRQLRKDPNVLKQGDQLFIPAVDTKQEHRATDQRHKFKKKGVPAMLRLRFLDGTEPRANEPYILEVEGKQITGNLDGDGRLETYIPPNARTGTITIGTGKTAVHHKLDLGHMEPASEQAGAIKRLKSLGYDCGLAPEKGFKQALKSFQADQKLPVTGNLDLSTQSKLREVFGC